MLRTGRSIMDSIFIECFGCLKDPRVERTKKHLLLDIIVIALCGVISGSQSWEEVEDFGNIPEIMKLINEKNK